LKEKNPDKVLNLMAKSLLPEKDYKTLLTDIKQKVKNARIKASIRVNTELITMYWELGETIVRKQSESNWGDGLIEQLSRDLSREFPEIKGFSRTNLFYILNWYSFYSDYKVIAQQLVGQFRKGVKWLENKGINPSGRMKKIHQLVGQFDSGVKHLELHGFNLYPQSKNEGQLVGQFKDASHNLSDYDNQDLFQNILLGFLGFVPWGHHIQIISKCKNIDEALFYIHQTIENNWSRSVLVHQLDSKLFERQGKSINNFAETLPEADSELASELMKNPYVFDFLNIDKKAKELDLQRALMDNLSGFLMELGYGFAFLGREKKLTVGDTEFYVDLVFYHTRLHCYFIVELKIDDFKPEYSGKLNFYLNAFNAEIKSPEDNPTIGLLLCKKADKLIAEYSLKELGNPIGVSEYRLYEELPPEVRDKLPSVDEIKRNLTN
jgi:predicted nuclease of restriction endonuclease-like (RecB) superfamily